MCLAIPGKVVEIREDKFIIDYNGERREAIMSLIDDLKLGDYVIVRAGFIIDKIPEKKAEEYLELIKNVGG